MYESFYDRYNPKWYDKYFEWAAMIMAIGSILFFLVGGTYCELAPGAPYC